jgi:hypothetical protein
MIVLTQRRFPPPRVRLGRVPVQPRLAQQLRTRPTTTRSVPFSSRALTAWMPSRIALRPLRTVKSAPIISLISAVPDPQASRYAEGHRAK